MEFKDMDDNYLTNVRYHIEKSYRKDEYENTTAYRMIISEIEKRNLKRKINDSPELKRAILYITSNLSQYEIKTLIKLLIDMLKKS